MSKRKMVAAEFNTIDTDSTGKPIESPVAADANATLSEKVADAASTVRISETVQDKLDSYEKMEQTVSALSKENEALKDKLAEYVEELAKLRSAEPKTVEVIKEVIKEVPVEKIVEKIVNVGSEEYSKLKNELESLRNENDSYLMRISELTFEIAKLTASMPEMEKRVNKQSVNANQPNSAANRQQGRAQYTSVYRNTINANGYTSWN